MVYPNRLDYYSNTTARKNSNSDALPMKGLADSEIHVMAVPILDPMFVCQNSLFSSYFYDDSICHQGL